MWEILKDYTIWVLGVAIAVWQIIEEARKNGSRFKIILFLILAVVLTWLGIDQINRNDVEKINNNKRFENLTTTIKGLEDSRKIDSANRFADSTKDAEFQKRLFEQYRIIRDSSSNKPVNYNTHIEKAENVKIGGN